MKHSFGVSPARHLRLLPAGVTLLVIGYSVAVGIFAGYQRNLIVLVLLAAPVGLLATIFTLRYFALVVLLLPITALAVPIDIPTGTESKVPISLLLTLVLTLIWTASLCIRGWSLAPSPINRPILLFGLICMISFGWGVIWRDPVLISAPKFVVTQVGALITILMSLCAGLLIGNFATTPARLKYLMGAFIFFGSLMLLTELFHIQQHFLADNGLWSMWFVAPVYGILIAQPNVRWRWRVLLLLLLVLALYQTIIVNKEWLSGWVPELTAIVAITFLHSRKAFVVFAIALAITGYLTYDFFAQVADDNIADGSLERLQLWEQNIQLVKEHWLFGTGPAGYAIYYMTYFRETSRSTHNNYFDILSQFGFAGLITWFWLSGAALWEGWRLIRRSAPGALHTLAIIATGGWFGALVAMFFGDWVLPFAYNVSINGYKFTVYTWLFLGTLIAIRKLLDAESANLRPRKSETI